MANIEHTLDVLLDEVIGRNASDIHFVAGYPPMIRIDSKLYPLLNDTLDEEFLKALIAIIAPPNKLAEFEVNKEIDLGYSHKNLARFRVNIYFTKGSPAVAMRLIPFRIKTLKELHLPPIIESFTQFPYGLVLVVGPTGSGKTTTIASMIDIINKRDPKHIVTIEDPIEYIFSRGISLVSQREVGSDTLGFKMALRSVLREDPDVVFIGEIRDAETAETALQVSETGHLVFSTLHTNNAAQTIERYVSLFSADKQDKIRAQLAYAIRAVVSQRLIPIQGGGRRPAVEIMIANDAIRNLIREGKFYQIDNVIKTSFNQGMVSLEYSLATLVKAGLITLEEAKKYSLAPEEIANWL